MRKDPKAFAARNRHVIQTIPQLKNLRVILQEVLWILLTGVF